MMLSRRSMMLAVAASPLLDLYPGARANAADLPLIRVVKAQAIGVGFLPIDVGEQAGIWQQVGVRLEVSALRGDGQVQQALTAGDADMGLGSGPGLGFVAKGVPAVAVGALSGAPASFGLVIWNKSPVKTVADLKGKRIAISTAGSLTDWLTKQLAIKQGWDATAITTVPLGDTKAALAAMQTGEVDGTVTGSEFGFDLEDHKQGHMLLTFGSVVPAFLTQVIYARNDFVAQHPDLVQKFLLGWYRSVAYMKTHRAQTLALASKIEEIGGHALGETYDDVMSVMSTDGAFKPEAVERLGKSFVELGILPQVPDMNKLITRQFVPVKV
jgi:ABC-type nitrate/sulfonate/bicarbonate transport system substrate-binding protein